MIKSVAHSTVDTLFQNNEREDRGICFATIYYGQLFLFKIELTLLWKSKVFWILTDAKKLHIASSLRKSIEYGVNWFGFLSENMRNGSKF